MTSELGAAGICQMFEEKLKQQNPGLRQLEYNIEDLWFFIDSHVRPWHLLSCCLYLPRMHQSKRLAHQEHRLRAVSKRAHMSFLISLDSAWLLAWVPGKSLQQVITLDLIMDLKNMPKIRKFRYQLVLKWLACACIRKDVQSAQYSGG